MPLSDKSQLILEKISQLSVSDLQQLYKIKEIPSQAEYKRWQDLKNGIAACYPAINLFNGLMYRHIKLEDNSDTANFVGKHLFITSAFYGIINALDPISKHRLDFNTPLKVGNKSLKHIWRKDYDEFIAKSQPILSLLSSEFEEVFSSHYRKKLIRVSFFEEKDGKLKKHSTISKKARGALLSQIVTKKITKIDDLRKLTFDDFIYSEARSNETELVFIKKA